jgi:hypothetical protein
MIYEFSAEQVEEINGLGFVSRYGAMQGLVVPSPDLPLTYESLVEQYEDQARYVSRIFGMDEGNWRMLAELWAGIDIDIFRSPPALLNPCRASEVTEEEASEYCSHSPDSDELAEAEAAEECVISSLNEYQSSKRPGNMEHPRPRLVKAKIERVVTELALVTLDRDGNIDEHMETLEEIDFECGEVLRIESILSVHE